MKNPLENFKNPWDIDGEYAQSFLNVDNVLNYALSKIEEEVSSILVQPATIFLVLVDDIIEGKPILSRHHGHDIVRKANDYFKHLKLDDVIRVRFFHGVLSDLKKIACNGVILVGLNGQKIANFVQNFAWAEGYHKALYKVEIDDAGFEHFFADPNAVGNPERSSLPSDNSGNIISLNYHSIQFEKILGDLYPHDPTDYAAFLVVHGLGHNAGIDTHISGIMTAGENILSEIRRTLNFIRDYKGDDKYISLKKYKGYKLLMHPEDNQRYLSIVRDYFNQNINKTKEFGKK